MLPMKDHFHLPEGMIYLDGNSLGPLPKSTPDTVANMLTRQWGDHLIKGWNEDDWMGQPTRVGNIVGRLIGAPEGSVTMGDTLSIKVFQELSSALDLRPNRRVVLSDSGNFPTDLYMAEGLLRSRAGDYELRVVPPEDIQAAITDEVAVMMLTQVDYRTGRMHDMAAITQAAHAAGAVMVWDLAHSAGAVPVDLHAVQCEFAVGCTYKYLNGGPGAPAFIYVRPNLIDTLDPVLCGWLGHDAPFAFEPSYRPAPGIERMRVGTPAVMQLTALEDALRIWDGVDMDDIRAASLRLSDVFIHQIETRCPELTLVSTREGALRGSQVSFTHPEGYAVMQALIAHDVVGDYRAPNIMLFGFTPLYIDENDVSQAVDRLCDILENRLWDTPEYRAAKRVT